MITFLYKAAFLLLLVPFLLRLEGRKAKLEHKALKVPFFEEISAIKSGRGRRGSRLNQMKTLIWIIWICLVFAVARPQSIGEKVLIGRESRIIVLALDASGSMNEPDFILNGQPVSRFHAMKKIVSDFIEKREGDRIGIVLFGTHAYIYAPPTDDMQSLRYLLETAEIGLVGGNTAIGDGLGMAVKMVESIPEDQRIVILLSDGVSNTGSLTNDEALKLAKQANMKIYTIGMGGNGVASFFGMSIATHTAIDEKSLSKMAHETGGKYYRSHNTKELMQIYDEINRLEPLADEGRYFRPTQELFFIPLAMAFVLSLWLFLFATKGGKNAR